MSSREMASAGREASASRALSDPGSVRCSVFTRPPEMSTTALPGGLTTSCNYCNRFVMICTDPTSAAKRSRCGAGRSALEQVVDPGGSPTPAVRAGQHRVARPAAAERALDVAVSVDFRSSCLAGSRPLCQLQVEPDQLEPDQFEPDQVRAGPGRAGPGAAGPGGAGPGRAGPGAAGPGASRTRSSRTRSSRTRWTAGPGASRTRWSRTRWSRTRWSRTSRRCRSRRWRIRWLCTHAAGIPGGAGDGVLAGEGRCRRS